MLAVICSRRNSNRYRTIHTLLYRTILECIGSWIYCLHCYSTVYALHNIPFSPFPPTSHSAVHDFSNDGLQYNELSRVGLITAARGGNTRALKIPAPPAPPAPGSYHSPVCTTPALISCRRMSSFKVGPFKHLNVGTLYCHWKIILYFSFICTCPPAALALNHICYYDFKRMQLSFNIMLKPPEFGTSGPATFRKSDLFCLI